MNCDGCGPPGGRRDFLKEIAALAAAAVAAAGVPGTVAAAMPVFASRGSPIGGQAVSYPIPSADGVEIDKKHEVILVRHGGAVYAFALACPHQNTALRFNDGDARFQCPKHKSRYQVDGTFISGRATRNMDRLPIRRDGPAVVVDVGKVFKSDDDLAGWRGAVVRL